MANSGDRASIQVRLEALRREPVVSLAQVRRLLHALRDLDSTHPGHQLSALVHAAIAESQVSTAAWLLDRVERILAAAEEAPVEELARRVARDEDFRRISRFVRRSQAQFGALAEDGTARIPYVDVGSYTRQGRPVRGYSRYVGYEHLRALPGLTDRPEVVQQVIRCLIDGRHRRHQPPGPS